MKKIVIAALCSLLALPVYGEERSIQSDEVSRIQLEMGKWVTIGSSEAYVITDAVLCESPKLVKEFIDLDFLAGHFPQGCGAYTAAMFEEGSVSVTIRYLENYENKAVVVEFDPVETGLRSFYGCLRLRQTTATSQAL